MRLARTGRHLRNHKCNYYITNSGWTVNALFVEDVSTILFLSWRPSSIEDKDRDIISNAQNCKCFVKESEKEVPRSRGEGDRVMHKHGKRLLQLAKVTLKWTKVSLSLYVSTTSKGMESSLSALPKIFLTICKSKAICWTCFQVESACFTSPNLLTNKVRYTELYYH